MAQQPHDVPTAANAENGEVMLDGPDGVATSMTPEAAMRSAESIRAAALLAQKQERQGGAAA